MSTKTEETTYNVACLDCGQVFQPIQRSPLWWRAHKRSEKYLDALPVTGEECGCCPKRHRPDAPFRVSGYDDMCQDYDVPFDTFVTAVRFFRQQERCGDIVFIEGVSDAVRDRIQWPCC